MSTAVLHTCTDKTYPQELIFLPLMKGINNLLFNRNYWDIDPLQMTCFM